jgi:hypothetical protein
MLAASAAIALSVCGTLRACFGDFLSLFSGTKISAPLFVFNFAFVVMVSLLELPKACPSA